MTFTIIGTAGDPVCPCGCGSWLGQCARAWNEQVQRQHWDRLAAEPPTYTLPAPLQTTFPGPDRCEIPGCRICGGAT